MAGTVNTTFVMEFKSKPTELKYSAEIYAKSHVTDILLN